MARTTEPHARDLPNGGLPLPRRGDAVRLVHPFHPGCGHRSRVRLPAILPASILQRVRCDHCAERYERDSELDADPPELIEAGGGASSRRWRWRPSGGADRELAGGSKWPWLAVPLAAVAVVAGLVVIQRADEPGTAPSTATTVAVSDPDRARFIERQSFSLALPAGWKLTKRPDGADLAAASIDELGDATLWVERDPGLSFEEFERRSLRQIEAITGGARVTDRVEGPTKESSIVEIRGGEGPDSPDYRVTLRAAGEHFHYLATTIAPGAPPKLAGDAEILHSSLLPTDPRRRR